MNGSVEWPVLYQLVAVGACVGGLMLWLWGRFENVEKRLGEIRDELKAEITTSRHTLRGEMQRQVVLSEQDDDVWHREIAELRQFIQKDSSEWRERVARLEVWRNGKP